MIRTEDPEEPFEDGDADDFVGGPASADEAHAGGHCLGDLTRQIDPSALPGPLHLQESPGDGGLADPGSVTDEPRQKISVLRRGPAKWRARLLNAERLVLHTLLSVVAFEATRVIIVTVVNWPITC
jgi:hypothetical protein